MDGGDGFVVVERRGIGPRLVLAGVGLVVAAAVAGWLVASGSGGSVGELPSPEAEAPGSVPSVILLDGGRAGVEPGELVELRAEASVLEGDLFLVEAPPPGAKAQSRTVLVSGPSVMESTMEVSPGNRSYPLLASGRRALVVVDEFVIATVVDGGPQRGVGDGAFLLPDSTSGQFGVVQAHPSGGFLVSTATVGGVQRGGLVVRGWPEAIVGSGVVVFDISDSSTPHRFVTDEGSVSLASREMGFVAAGADVVVFADGTGRLVVVDPQGAETRDLVVPSGGLFGPGAVSPDSTWVAVTAIDAETDTISVIVVADLSGGEPVLVPLPGELSVSRPVWVSKEQLAVMVNVEGEDHGLLLAMTAPNFTPIPVAVTSATSWWMTAVDSDAPVITVDEELDLSDPDVPARVSDSVVRGNRHRYRVQATEGQTMNLAITALEDNAAMDLVGPDGTIMASEVALGTVLIPETGRYEIIVGGTRGNATYELTVTIEP